MGETRAKQQRHAVRQFRSDKYAKNGLRKSVIEKVQPLIGENDQMFEISPEGFELLELTEVACFVSGKIVVEPILKKERKNGSLQFEIDAGNSKTVWIGMKKMVCRVLRNVR